MSALDDDTLPDATTTTAVDPVLGAFAHHLGLTLIETTADKVVARWIADEKHHQPDGIVHGGVHCSVVEALGSIGAAMWAGSGRRCVGVSNTTDFLRPVSHGALTSVATPIHRGRVQQLWLVETRDRSDRLIARGQVRVQNLDSLGGGV